MSKSEKDGPTGPATLQTVDRALSFLEVVAGSAAPLRIKDVATALGVNLSTCYHLFHTLADRDYIVRNPDQTLRVGHRAAALYDGYRRSFSMQEQMDEFVARLAESSRETAWLSTLVNDSVVLTAFVDGPQAVRATGLHVGLSGFEHVRASGRAVMAFLDEDRRAGMLEGLLADVPPPRRPEAIRELESDFEQIRARGWALDDEGFNAGIVGIAAPYFLQNGDVAGAVGIWAPTMRGHEHLDALVEQVEGAAREATDSFGRHA